MKFKTTAKEIRESAYNPLAIGYSELQYLLFYKSPDAYTCGIYGWNFDVYQLDGATICTGYRGMVGKKVPYEITRYFNKKAEKIIHDWNIPYEEKAEKLDVLIRAFCKSAKTGKIENDSDDSDDENDAA